MPSRRIPYGVQMPLGHSASANDDGITPFQALITSVSATIGTGNISDLAGALQIGDLLPCLGCWPVVFQQ
ncbi:alanine:cation symporter family protein [Prochlorococcus marinus]|nr:alanine:cation symporter family protein [Prochlorococcus marinus]